MDKFRSNLSLDKQRQLRKESLDKKRQDKRAKALQKRRFPWLADLMYKEERSSESNDSREEDDVDDFIAGLEKDITGFVQETQSDLDSL
jgi:hypothetical protein